MQRSWTFGGIGWDFYNTRNVRNGSLDTGGEGENYGRIEELKAEDGGSILTGDEGRGTSGVNAMVPPEAPGERSSSLLVCSPVLARMRGRKKKNRGR
jgi:hypothetical protein